MPEGKDIKHMENHPIEASHIQQYERVLIGFLVY